MEIAGLLRIGGDDPKALRDAAERVAHALRRQREKGVVTSKPGPSGRGPSGCSAP